MCSASGHGMAHALHGCQQKTSSDQGQFCAGVVGLAIARSLALNGQKVLVIEQAKAIGTETSSRNSEVIHSGANAQPHRA